MSYSSENTNNEVSFQPGRRSVGRRSLEPHEDKLSRRLAGPLKVKVSALEADILSDDAESGKAFKLTYPEPWPHCFDGAELVAEIVRLLRSHVVMSEEQAVAMALWIFLTYLEGSVDVLPISMLKPKRFSTWGPKAIACIRKLQETLSDRSIEIRLQRKTKAEKTVPFRDASPETFKRLSRQLMSWSLDNSEKIKAARPALPAILNDRAADNWHPLLAIAETLGGDWLLRATKAAVALSADNEDEGTLTIKILSALQAIFKLGVEFMPTAELIEILNDDKEAPWAEWKNKMTAERLGRTLKTFEVKSERPRKEGERPRGYSRQTLDQAFKRYLTLLPPENVAQPGPPSADQVSEPLQPGPGLNNEPGPGQAKEMNLAQCESAPRANPQAVVQVGQVEKGGAEKESLNGPPLVAFATRIFGGEIATADEPEPDLSCPPEPKSTANPEPKAQPHPRPGYSALENRLIQILAPYDYDGGLSYGEWLRLSRLTDEIFDQTLKDLCRRGGPVYRSGLNGRFQFRPQFAEILARQKASGNGSTQPSDLP